MIEQFGVAVLLGILGLLLGSFAGATVWRLRAWQLAFDKKQGYEVDDKEWHRLKPLTKEKLASDRSRCLHCGYTLKWYDLIPLFSWLSLKGRCRSCHKPIGRFEPLIELGTALFFVASYLLWPLPLVSPLDVSVLAVWLLAGLGLVILFAYDLKWFLLPDKVTYAVVGLGVISVIMTMVQVGDVGVVLANAIGSVAILSGLYLALYLISKGRWIGFGDVKLGLGLGLLLGDWQLAILALFLANFIGCLIVIPLMIQKKLDRNSQVPFGPLLIAGTVIAKLFGLTIISWYTFGLF